MQGTRYQSVCLYGMVFVKSSRHLNYQNGRHYTGRIPQTIMNNMLFVRCLQSGYKKIISEGLKEEPPPHRIGNRGRLKNSKGRNLLLHLQSNMKTVLEFAYNPINQLQIIRQKETLDLAR